MNKRHKIVDSLIKSCEQGISGEWNCSKEGFEAMISELQTLRSPTLDIVKEEVVAQLNYFQELGYIKITNYENLTISLRAKLEKEVSPEINEWIKEWSKLWNGKKADGYYLAQPPKENLNRMVIFMRENPQFSKETITLATQRYLEEKEAVNFQYAKKSHKYIADQDGSILYAYCIAIENGDSEKSNERVGGI